MNRLLAVVAAMLLLAAPAAAKVDLSGSMYATYWAQQEGVDGYQLATAAGWTDAPRQATGALYRGGNFTASKKTFLLGQNRVGNGLQTHTEGGYGVLLALDCPVSDQWKVYGRFSMRSSALPAAVRHLWAAYTPMPELNFRIGRSAIPFGNEGTENPTEKIRRIFISDYTQDNRGSLLSNYDIGVMTYGILAGGMADYKLWVGNGAVTTVADSINYAINGTAAGTLTMMPGNTASPDANDAKQVVGNIKFKPFAGAYLGGSYAAGDYSNLNQVNGVAIQRARFSAADVYAGYELANVFRAAAEYATTRHDRMSLESDAGLSGAPALRQALVANRVNEYVLKAFYLGVPDWEFGVRYAVVDPKNFEAELAAGYSMEKKISAALGYRFAGAASLNAEYSHIDTDLDYLGKYNAAAIAGSYIVNPSADPDDDIFALQLALQF